MNPRASMGRLGPTTVKFDIGRGGGKPDLTNQDIAAAPGMVLAGLGWVGSCWRSAGGQTAAPRCAGTSCGTR
ncbi:MAG: hypothetical protein WBH11_05590 [Stenotrophomonas geniculata]|nr:hypothetical protein [Stenotrophomonas geniculata]